MSSLSADDTFLNYYGFSHDPFASRVPGFKFFPAQRKPVLGQLHHLARYSQLLLVVTGPEGSGKTLLRQALVASSNKQTVQSVVITPQGSADASVVLQQVAQALGGVRADFDGVLAQIIQLGLTGQEVYLLVDDAERLTGAAVETLLRLAQGSPEGRPHVFLFGEQALVPRLEALVDDQELFHIIALQPYDEDETREYLALRLEGAGRGLECLNEQQIERIHEVSEGWPGVINQVARDELVEAMQASGSSRRKGGWLAALPIKHMVAVLAVLLLIGLGFLFSREAYEEASAPKVTNGLPLDGAFSGREQDSTAIEFEGAGEPQPVIREPLAASGEIDEDFAGIERDNAPSIPAPAPAPAPVAVPVPAPATAPAPVAPPVAKAPAPVEKPREAPVPVRPIVADKPKAAPLNVPDSSANWYAAQNGSHYLVQVLGTSSEANARELVRKHGANYHYFVKQHQGKPLYVVTYGSFSSRAAAVAAIKTLPANLQAGKPWARTFASVQQEIR
ncbi:cell division protein [Stutzerimonas kirkiae]|uniref:Cell division protein n=1 Tax=Stutzerimonas kirkiae TaxID=2211392 RepID=A0A4Q9R0I8_9GAMM|nr:AAA family ATPase [Stutzerimonas kirkiae]TBU92166.1 cell division protein [Stutzerimonas kirkiae]TBV01146.1 cell division protein [Stutzerimonas kirkiae]